MSAARQTVFGLERDGRRIVTVAGHAMGACIYLAPGQGLAAMTPDDAEHIARLLNEAATNARLKDRAEESV